MASKLLLDHHKSRVVEEIAMIREGALHEKKAQAKEFDERNVFFFLNLG